MMRFANIENIEGYRCLLDRNSCEVLIAEDTGRFAPVMELVLNLTEMQLTYDVLKAYGFNRDLLQLSIDGSRFLYELARGGKIAQARFLARRR